MHKPDLLLLLEYAFWADNEILSACERLTWDELTRPVTPDPGWGSLRGTLVHLLDTEYGWRAALQGQPDEGVLRPTDFPDLASLRARYEAEHAAWLEYAAGLSEAELNAAWRPDVHRPRWQTILHVINDGTHHRSEAAFLLTCCGQSPGELDFEGYLVWRG